MRTCSKCVCLALLLAAIGCGSRQPERVKIYPARGAVIFKGQPAAGAIVRVHGVAGATPRAVVRKDGTFALTTYEAGDGVPPGRYRVSVYWRRQGQEDGDEGPFLIPERYSRPESSGLEIEIKPEAQNDLSPFNLKP